MGSFIRKVTKRLQERRDQRGQLVAGLLEGMRLIKLQGSQEFYRRELTAARELEMKELMWQRYLSAGNELLGSLLSISVPISMFSWYTLVQGRVLDAATAFTALAWCVPALSAEHCGEAKLLLPPMHAIILGASVGDSGTRPVMIMAGFRSCAGRSMLFRASTRWRRRSGPLQVTG